jgi:hypothetical protein
MHLDAPPETCAVFNSIKPLLLPGNAPTGEIWKMTSPFFTQVYACHAVCNIIIGQFEIKPFLA